MNKLIIILSLSVCTLFAQNSNSLFMVMSSNSMLERPEIFREMQISISEELGELEYGLGVEKIQKKITSFKNGIILQLEMISVILETTKDGKEIILKFKYPKENSADSTESLDLIFPRQTINLSLIVDSLKSQEIKEFYSKKINKALKKVLNQIGIEYSTKKAILYTITKILKQLSYITKPFDETTDVDEMAYDISEVIASELLNRTYDFITNSFEFRELEEYLINTTPKIDNFIIQINKALQKLIKEPIHNFTKLLDETEFIITKQVDAFNKHLISANIGAAITDSEGNFAGGLNYLFRLGTNFQIGVYANGQFVPQEVDTIQNTSSLYGFQLRYVIKRYEFNFLASYLNMPDISDATEIGAGLSTRNGDNFIIGISYFGTYYFDIPPGHLLGISFKGINSDSPAILIGANYQQKNITPIFQISYPILSK